jgi:hypothetical protein
MEKLKTEIFTELERIKEASKQNEEFGDKEFESLFLISLLEEEANERPPRKSNH